MLRLVFFLCGVVALAVGLSWLADRPGSLLITWQGYEIETSVFRAVVILAMLLAFAILLWSLLRQLWLSPAVLGAVINRRRQRRGLEALSGGMIAIGAGDKTLATRYAQQARKSLPNEPLTHLLRAQAAQLSDDRITSRRIFEAMLGTPDTEQLGLRGLFLEAEREGAHEAAKQFAERAVRLNPKLGWSLDALFDIQCRQGDWPGALETIVTARRHMHIDKPTADRRRAVLLCAQAQVVEDSDPARALHLAMEAHGLAPDLIPAAAIAGRLLAARGNTPRATKVLQRTWKLSPHPELATAFAYARLGDSPRDRLQRVAQLAALRPYAIESPIAVATAAIEARDWDAARRALEPLNDGRMTQRACTLMARIEGEEHRDAGRVREWLARAVHAPRDPAWTADGFVSDRWMPVSPVTGALDAFVWRAPLEPTDKVESDALSEELEQLMRLTAESPPVAAAVAAEPAAMDIEPSGPQRPPEASARLADGGVLEVEADLPVRVTAEAPVGVVLQAPHPARMPRQRKPGFSPVVESRTDRNHAGETGNAARDWAEERGYANERFASGKEVQGSNSRESTIRKADEARAPAQPERIAEGSDRAAESPPGGQPQANHRTYREFAGNAHVRASPPLPDDPGPDETEAPAEPRLSQQKSHRAALER